MHLQIDMNHGVSLPIDVHIWHWHLKMYSKAKKTCMHTNAILQKQILQTQIWPLNGIHIEALSGNRYDIDAKLCHISHLYL